MATFTVINTDATGAGSLRDNIGLANAAPDADTIVFQNGLSGTIDLAGTGALQVTESLTIVGAGSDKLTIAADKNSQILEIASTTGTVIDTAVSGVTLTGVSGLGGAALFAGDANLTLNDVKITGNTADPTILSAAVAFLGQGDLTIENSTISNNSGLAGGVLYGGQGDLTIKSSTISNNNADTGGFFPGGGGVTFIGPGALTIDKTTIADNKADPITGVGGVYAQGSAITISGSTISGNSGGVGGVFVSVGDTLVVNTTIANNTGGGGAGGLLIDSAQAVIKSSTVVGNVDTTPFAVADAVGAMFADVKIENSVIYSAGGAPDLVNDGSIVVADNSLVGDYASLCGCQPDLLGSNNLIGVNPSLGPLANNGGPVMTMAPLENSPLINNGNSTLSSPPATDATGQARISGGQIDLGAFEVQAPRDPGPPPPPSQAPLLDVIFANILRIPANSHLSSSTVTTADGRTLPNPLLAQQAVLQQLVAAVDAKLLPLQEAIDRIVDLADATTSVATLTAQFFTGKPPTQAELDRLVFSAQNPADLNDGRFAGVSLENRYIDFAIGLGKSGEGRADFEAAYGGLSLSQAATKAYTEIFGAAPTGAKLDALLTQDMLVRFNTAGGDALGAKAAMVGWLLAEAARTDAGPYAALNETFLYDLADGQAGFGTDLLHGYKTVGLVGTADVVIG